MTHKPRLHVKTADNCNNSHSINCFRFFKGIFFSILPNPTVLERLILLGCNNEVRKFYAIFMLHVNQCDGCCDYFSVGIL